MRNPGLSSAVYSTFEPNYIYDIFLSCRSESKFRTTLCDAMRKKGINSIFIDDDSKKVRKRKRKQISGASPSRLRAIERSRISIVVFSENYASSAESMDELVQIMKCRRKKKQVVFPIFYQIDPSDVRHQRNRYGEAMAAHEDRFRDDLRTVQKWRFALTKAAGLSGWHFQDGSEYGFIERIVEEASSKLPPKRLHTGEHIVGLTSCIEEVKSLLRSNTTVRMLGIHGTAGIGKTTLAKAVYNSILHQFEGAGFLFNVREASKRHNGIVRLQQTLVSEILEEKKKIKLKEGMSKIKHRLHHKRVLLVLDDVDETEQLDQLVGSCDWFGNGSRIIVTTRNKGLLIDRRFGKKYRMKELNDSDSLELFSWYAFHLDQPPVGYGDMCKSFVSYAQGLPSALKVMGSNLNNKSLEAWKCALEQCERIPERKIQDVLKIMGKRGL